jgi:hypothetical protein
MGVFGKIMLGAKTLLAKPEQGPAAGGSGETPTAREAAQ